MAPDARVDTEAISLRQRITPAGEAEVVISGHLEQASAGTIYGYLEDIISEGHPVTVCLRKATCDRSGVACLATAANLAARAGRSFRITGPGTLLMLIAAIADSGDIKVRWFRDSTLVWPAPVDVRCLPPVATAVTEKSSFNVTAVAIACGRRSSRGSSRLRRWPILAR